MAAVRGRPALRRRRVPLRRIPPGLRRVRAVPRLRWVPLRRLAIARLRGRLAVAVRLLRVAVLRVRVSRRLLTVLPVAAVLLVPVRRRRLSVVAVAIRGWGLVLARVGSVLLLRGGCLDRKSVV